MVFSSLYANDTYEKVSINNRGTLSVRYFFYLSKKKVCYQISMLQTFWDIISSKKPFETSYDREDKEMGSKRN